MNCNKLNLKGISLKMIKVKLENIKIREDIEEIAIVEKACKINKISNKDVIDYKIIKKSIDARNKNDIFYNYSILVTLKDNKKLNKKSKNIIILNNEESFKESPKIESNIKSNKKPVIIGAGPAGLFCALTLINNGIKVEERKKDVEQFLKEGKLNPLSNVQFGEGGAGTFSDGKLTTNLHNPLCRTVINEFVKFGAPDQISYINKPHIGTDNLIKIIANIRNYIIEKGGVFLFNTKAQNFIIENNKIKSVFAQIRIKQLANT